MTLLCLVAFLFLRGVAGADAWSPPPGTRPVEVAVGVFLVNLSGVAERSETFNADLYLSVRWRDPRLAFAGTEPVRFLEDAAVEQLKQIEQLKQMWWPQLEFVNTAAPDVTNRALEIKPRRVVGAKGENPHCRPYLHGAPRTVRHRGRRRTWCFGIVTDTKSKT